MEVTFNSGTFLVMMINFIILMYVLVKLLYRPVQGILEERRQTIARDYAAAEKAKQDAEQLQAEARKKMEESHVEAYEIIERARNEAERLRDELITQARREADQLRQRSQKEIERAKQIARMELKEEAVELALLSVKKVFEKNKTSQLNDALIRGVLEEINKGALENELPGNP
ncbi:MAG: F0F1 ATP synthase subunit B [Bacteroidota bacterium]